MKKILIILQIALMSVVFINQTSINIYSLHPVIHIESVLDSSVQLEDNCEEDIISNSNANSFHLILQDNLSGALSPFTVSISQFVWQPPE